MSSPKWSEEKTKEFDDVTKPVIKWLCENTNPHTKVIIEPDSAELVSGEMGRYTKEFIKD